jgi:hypothetical protein
MGLSTFSEVASGFLVLCLPVLPHLYKNMRRYMGFASEQSNRMTIGLERAQRRLPRSWLHISQDSAQAGTAGSTASAKQHGITRTDQVIIEFMSLNSTDSILPPMPEHILTNKYEIDQ